MERASVLAIALILFSQGTSFAQPLHQSREKSPSHPTPTDSVLGNTKEHPESLVPEEYVTLLMAECSPLFSMAYPKFFHL